VTDVTDARRIGDRCLIAGGGSWLVATLVGGALLGAMEGVGLDEGLWLAFSVVSTAGYVAPGTAAGRGVVVVVFAWALVSYVLLLTGSVVRCGREPRRGTNRGAVWSTPSPMRTSGASWRLSG
jgi:hypothetical protein